jgi:hypothetical protein
MAYNIGIPRHPAALPVEPPAKVELVAKRRDSRYRSGRCREWIKIKNPAHPAIERAMLIALSKRRWRRSASRSSSSVLTPRVGLSIGTSHSGHRWLGREEDAVTPTLRRNVALDS